MEFTEKQISAVARVLSDRSAYDCGVHKDDNWHVYGKDYLESAKAALAVLSAAAPQVVADERAYTAEEVRKIFLDQVRHLVSYWERESREPTAKGKLEGLAFSIMNIFDGTSGLPAFDIVCAPHPDDKQYHIDEGSKYFVPGMVINECRLHELLFSGRASAPVPTYRNDPTVQGMADCMDMVRQELIEAGVIGAGVAPMFIANAVVAKLAAPVQAQEPFMFGIMGPDGKAHMDEHCVAPDAASLYDELNGLNDSPDTGYSIVPLYAAPVQPVAVPDGPSAEDYSDMLRAFFFHYASGGYNDEGGLVPLETAKDKLEWIVNEAIQHAASAAQGDALKRPIPPREQPLPNSGNEPDWAAYAKAEAEAAQVEVNDAARWREALKYVGADRSPALGCNYFVLRGIHAIPGTDLMRGGVAGHFTDAIDAAIAAKAAS